MSTTLYAADTVVARNAASTVINKKNGMMGNMRKKLEGRLKKNQSLLGTTGESRASPFILSRPFLSLFHQCHAGSGGGRILFT